MMRKQARTALVLAALLTFAGCSKDDLTEDSGPTTVVVTVEYQNGKLVRVYNNELIWQSDSVKSVSYQRKGDRTEIAYTDLKGQNNHLTFQGGKLIKTQ